MATKKTVYYKVHDGKYWIDGMQFSSYAAMRKAIKSTFRLKKTK